MVIPGDGGERAQLVRTAVEPDETVSMAILRAVAAVDDERIEELPQLYATVDPDALCELVEDDCFEGILEFQYNGYVVAVDGGGRIEINDGETAR